MNLPNGNNVIIPIEKLVGYCLNPNHSSGKHKAKVFKSALGITIENAEVLRGLILIAAREGKVVQESQTQFGQLYKVDWEIPEQPDLILRTIWEIKLNSPFPRLISSFIK